MGTTTAYWITPKGKVLQASNYHIGTVINNPEWFGMTDKQLKDIYDKHNEKMSHFLEGKAREEIMTKLLQKKFIRIRQKIMGSYTVQLNRITVQLSDYLWMWANKESKQTQDKYADVNIHVLKGNKMIRTSLDRIASGENIDESIKNKRHLTEKECESIKFYDEKDINEIPSYFEYAEEIIDEETDQWIIDEVLEYKHKTMMKYLK